MLLAILLVLILIACILAPWLIPFALAAVSLYGVFIVVIGAVVVSVTVGGFVIFVVGQVLQSRRDNQKRIESEIKISRQIEESNRIFREKERLAEIEKSMAAASEKPVIRMKIVCQSCTAEIDRASMYCPVCGKAPRLSAS